MARRNGQGVPGWLWCAIRPVDAVGIAALQIGVSESATHVQLSNNMWLTGWGFVGKMFTSANFVAVLNLILWGVLYVILLMLTNRFWVATPIFLAVTFIVAVIEHFKVSIRYEAILPKRSELPQSRCGQSDEFHAVRRAMDHSDRGGGVCRVRGAVRLPEPPRRASRQTVSRLRQAIPFREHDRKTAADPASRPVLHAVYSMQVSTVGSWAKGFATVMGDGLHVGLRIRRPAQRAAGGVHPSAQPETMVKPDDYSEETMKQVAARYEKAAKKINAKRSANMTDSTVIYVLSESFSDPSRVPGLKVDKNCMPKRVRSEYHVRPDAVLRIRRRHRQLGIHGTVRPEHGEFRLPPDHPMHSWCRASIGRRQSTRCGAPQRTPSACTRTNRLCIRAPPTTRSSASRISIR